VGQVTGRNVGLDGTRKLGIDAGETAACLASTHPTPGCQICWIRNALDPITMYDDPMPYVFYVRWISFIFYSFFNNGASSRDCS